MLEIFRNSQTNLNLLFVELNQFKHCQERPGNQTSTFKRFHDGPLSEFGVVKSQVIMLSLHLENFFTEYFQGAVSPSDILVPLPCFHFISGAELCNRLKYQLYCNDSRLLFCHFTELSGPSITGGSHGDHTTRCLLKGFQEMSSLHMMTSINFPQFNNLSTGIHVSFSFLTITL